MKALIEKDYFMRKRITLAKGLGLGTKPLVSLQLALKIGELNPPSLFGSLPHTLLILFCWGTLTTPVPYTKAGALVGIKRIIRGTPSGRPSPPTLS